jgi:PKD repeat protein
MKGNTCGAVGVVLCVILAVNAFADLQPTPADVQVTEEWVVRFDGPKDVDKAADIVVSSSGNVYVTGESIGNGTDMDYATVAYDTFGNERWVARYDGPVSGTDSATAITMGPEGNIYVTGTSVGNGTDRDIATLAYDSSGNELWVARFDSGAGEHESASAIAVDAKGNVYVAGTSRAGDAYLSLDYVTIAYDSSGKEQWVSYYNNFGQEEAHDMAVDSKGYVYVTGKSETADRKAVNYATVAYDQFGNQLWVARYLSGRKDHGDNAFAIALDSKGNVYVTGSSWGNEVTRSDYATVAYNQLGSELWVARFNGPGNGYDHARDLALDSDGNVYVTGDCWHDSSLRETVVAYDSSGKEQWTASFPDGGIDYGIFVKAIAADERGSVYAMGDNFMVVAYHTSGSELWRAHPSIPGGGFGRSRAMALDSDANVYITGWVNVGGSDYDFFTVKYSQEWKNQAPLADAGGPYHTDEGSSMALDGSDSYDPDGDTVKYRWDWDNDGVWDSSWSSDPTLTHTWMDNGSYTVVVQVKDPQDEMDTDSTVVYVRDLTPTAAFSWSPEPQDEGSPVSFSDQSSSYPDTMVSWSWEFGDGGTSTDEDPAHAYGDNGVYAVRLTVMDDDGSVATISHDITVLNVAPISDAGEDKEGWEAATFTFNGSFYDPGVADTHTFEWDFEYDGATFVADATGQTVSHTWPDDFNGYVALRVTDDDGGVGIDTAYVSVRNVPPSVTLEVLPVDVDVSLRIAGEKWHDVTIEMYEDGELIAGGTLVRYPGSPDDQRLDLSQLQVDYSKKYSAIVRYTPEDDPINGQPNGANPCWIILNFSDGEELWIHHTFNVQRPETYIWEVDLTAAILMHGLKFEATAFDPGADDLTFHWDFGDGTSATSFHPNANGTYPVEITNTVTHAFSGSGVYIVTLTVEDDDGGVGVAKITIIVS